MATIDFPSSPTVGQEYPFGDFIYVWDGVKWTTKVIVGSEGYVLKSGDTMTGPLRIENDDVEPSVGVKRRGRTLYMYDSGSNMGIYTTYPNSEFPSASLITRSVTDGNIAIGTGSSYVGIVSPHSNSTQGSNVNSLTRKDYVDGIVNKKLNLSGGTMTGPITGKTAGSTDNATAFVAATTGGLNADMYRRRGPYHTTVSHTGSSYAPSFSMYYHDIEGWEGNWSIGTLGAAGAGADALQIMHYHGRAAGGASQSFSFTPTGQLNLPTAPSGVGSATRKDYVDSTVVAAKEELEATIATLLARIETLEAQVNPAP